MTRIKQKVVNDIKNTKEAQTMSNVKQEKQTWLDILTNSLTKKGLFQ